MTYARISFQCARVPQPILRGHPVGAASKSSLLTAIEPRLPSTNVAVPLEPRANASIKCTWANQMCEPHYKVISPAEGTHVASCSAACTADDRCGMTAVPPTTNATSGCLLFGVRERLAAIAENEVQRIVAALQRAIPNGTAGCPSIPKVIYQSLKSRCSLPVIAAKSIATKFPGFSHVVLEDGDCVTILGKLNTTYAEAFRMLPNNSAQAGSHKGDMCRYAIMYVVGGVWMDADLQPLSADETLFSQHGGKYLYSAVAAYPAAMYQAILASCPGRPVFLQLLNLMVAHLLGGKYNPRQSGYFIRQFMQVANQITHNQISINVKLGKPLGAIGPFYLFREFCNKTSQNPSNCNVYDETSNTIPFHNKYDGWASHSLVTMCAPDVNAPGMVVGQTNSPRCFEREGWTVVTPQFSCRLGE
jgi:hypothetical protein